MSRPSPGRTRLTRSVASAAAAVVVLLPLAGCGSDGPGDPGEEAGQVETVFVGDSVTAGVSPETLAPSEEFSWVTYAAADERSPWSRLTTAALYGRTLPDMQGVFATEVLALDPEGVVIMGGTNDALRQLPVEPSMAALRSMIEAVRDAGAEVWVVSPPPLDASYQRPVAPYVEAERALAEELDVPFVDVATELTGSDGRWLPGLSADGVHPSEAGAERIADLVLDELGR